MASAEVVRLYNELMETEVFPAVIKFMALSPIVTANGGVTDGMVMLADSLPLGYGSLHVRTWEFQDYVSSRTIGDVMKLATGVLGMSKDMFWVGIFAYALFQGLRDYRKLHDGNLPDDATAYMYAMLTCDNPGEEVRKDF